MDQTRVVISGSFATGPPLLLQPSFVPKDLDFMIPATTYSLIEQFLGENGYRPFGTCRSLHSPLRLPFFCGNECDYDILHLSPHQFMNRNAAYKLTECLQKYECRGFFTAHIGNQPIYIQDLTQQTQCSIHDLHCPNIRNVFS